MARSASGRLQGDRKPSFTPLREIYLWRQSPFSTIDPIYFHPRHAAIRWPPTLMPTPDQALSRLFVLPGSHYEGPELAGNGPLAGRNWLRCAGLGPQHAGNLFVEPLLRPGRRYLSNSNSTPLTALRIQHTRLNDRVDNNDYKFDDGKSLSLLAGRISGSLPTSSAARTATCT